MTLPQQPPQPPGSQEQEHHPEHSQQRAQQQEAEDRAATADGDGTPSAAAAADSEPPSPQAEAGHPYGVQPWGNYYLTRVPEIRTAGLGALSVLPDEQLLGLLFALPAADLGRFGLASRAAYVFAHTSDLWKALVLQELGGAFDWCGSWRETYLQHAAPPGSYAPHSHVPLRVAGLYSDFLHQPWLCATVDLNPAWLEVDNIDRRAGLTPEQFRAEYEARNRPVLLTDGAADWPALTKWDRAYLAAALAGRPVIVGNAAWRFGSYLRYCADGAAGDEMPLYLFDKAFASACPHLVGDYRVPSVFAEDLFEVLGEEGRPDYRWLVVGPHRSGSSFHVDPNATCAWNAVVSGAKKWILFPPGCPPPGVYPSPDGADVAAPVSIIEWFLNFYDEARASKVPPIECICRAGEVLYVPRGWWHCVVNLGHTVAVTQNFVSSVGLPRVLDFLQPGRADLVSGCAAADRASLHDRFVAALQQQRPEVMAALHAQQERQRQQREAEHRLSLLFKGGQETGAGAAASGHQQEGMAAPAAGDGVSSPVGGAGFSFGFTLAADAGSGGGDAQQQQQEQQLGFSFGFSVPPGSGDGGDAGAGSAKRTAGGDGGVEQAKAEEEEEQQQKRPRRA